MILKLTVIINKAIMNNVLETIEYNPLYGYDKKNTLKEWTIKVERFEKCSKVIYSYGKVGGKKTECILTIERGKNLGKKNETNHFTQALNEAEQRIRQKKNKDNYSEVKPDLCGSPSKVLLPMLAHEFQKHKHKIQFPCYVQPKLDGYRMIYDSDNHACKSRTGKVFEVLKDTNMYKQLKMQTLSLDGELYVHDKSFNFENYGILRKKKINDVDKLMLNRISFFVYDIPDEKAKFEDRMTLLQSKHFGDKIQVVPTFECNDLDEIDIYHRKFIEEGYEGTMVRNRCGFYKCKFRSHNLLKYKSFNDDEFEIIGFTKERDTGNNMDLVVWKCITHDKSKTFNVQSKGTRTERNELYKEGEKYLGKMLWVQYFGFTADGIPRFPKTYREGICSIREVIN